MSRPTSITDADYDLIGREDELSVLLAALEAAVAGRGGVVVVQAPPGYGRTSLLTAFADAIGEATVLRTTCAPAEAQTGYAAAHALFAGLWTVPPQVNAGVAATLRAMNDLYHVALGLMARRPLVLIIDDADHCDAQTAAWLDFLARRVRALPCLVVVAMQATHWCSGPTRLHQVLSRSSPVTVQLPPLDDRAVHALIVRAGVAAPSPGLVAACRTSSHGNPLLLNGMLAAMVASGAADRTRWVLQAGREHVVSAQFGLLADRLPDALDVAAAIAVLDEADPALVTPLAGTDRETVIAVIETLRRTGLLDDDKPADAAFHAGALSRLPAGRLDDLRARAAQLLSDAGRPTAGQLLRRRARPEPWMTAMLRDAAYWAERAGDFDLAVRCLARVLQAQPGDETRVALARNQIHVEPAKAYAALFDLIGRTGDVRARAQLAALFGQAAAAAQRSAAAFGILSATADALTAECYRAPQPGDDDLLGLVRYVLLLVGIKERSTHAEALRRIRGLPDPLGRVITDGRMLGLVAWIGCLGNGPAHTVTAHARAAVRALEPTPQSSAVLPAAAALFLADDAERALSVLNAAVADRIDADGTGHGLARTIRALVRMGCGDLPGAMADARVAIAASPALLPDSLLQARIVLAHSMIYGGMAGLALRLLDQLLCLDLVDQAWGYPLWLRVRAMGLNFSGDIEGALRLLRHCGQALADGGITNPLVVPWWVDAACHYAVLGRPDDAAELIEPSLLAADRWATPRAHALALLARGVLAHGDERLYLLGQATALASGGPARLEESRIRHRLACAQRDAGDNRAAREEFRRVIDISRACGAPVVTGLAEQGLLSAGGRRRAASDGTSGLTASELRVSGMAARGDTNRQIAGELFLSQRTVEIHLTAAYRKLGVPGRTALAAALADRQALAHGRPQPASSQETGPWRLMPPVTACGPSTSCASTDAIKRSPYSARRSIRSARPRAQRS